MKKAISNSVLALVGVSILSLLTLLPSSGFSQTTNNAAENPYEYVDPAPDGIKATFPDDPGPEPIAPEGIAPRLPSFPPVSCGTLTYGENIITGQVDLGPCK